MGDRANIKLKESNGNSIYVYTHWEGHEWPEKLQAALRAGEDRWYDEQYLFSFIVRQMCPSEPLTGYGLSTGRGDNEHDVIEVDPKAQMVRKLSRKLWDEPGEGWPAEVLQEWTFTDYCAAELDAAQEAA